MRNRASQTTVAVVMAFAALTACSKSSVLTKDQLIAKADALCTDQTAAIQNLTLNSLDAPTAENLSDWHDALGPAIPIFEKLIEDLTALEPPSADKAKIDEMIGHLRDEVAAIKVAQDAAAAGDLEAFTAAVQQTTAADDAALQIATDYGFKVCGQ